MAFVDTEARPAGEVQQKVGKLRLSEAIRIGARIRPQCTGHAFKEGKSCALGAAYEGFYGKSWPEADWETFPNGFIRDAFGYKGNISEIMIRNDNGESRESIATWLESQGL